MREPQETPSRTPAGPPRDYRNPPGTFTDPQGPPGTCQAPQETSKEPQGPPQRSSETYFHSTCKPSTDLVARVWPRGMRGATEQSYLHIHINVCIIYICAAMHTCIYIYIYIRRFCDLCGYDPKECIAIESLQLHAAIRRLQLDVGIRYCN